MRYLISKSIREIFVAFLVLIIYCSPLTLVAIVVVAYCLIYQPSDSEEKQVCLVFFSSCLLALAAIWTLLK